MLGSEPLIADNFLDRHTAAATLERNYAYTAGREQLLVSQRLALRGGDVLSVGCGWHPGRHLFPAPMFRLVGVDVSGDPVSAVKEAGTADDAFVGRAGELEVAPESFDVVLYRLVLHHIAFREPLTRCFAEAARILRPGGALVAIEPSLWNPVGAALAAANAAGLGVAVHGTPDDVPLSPRVLRREARKAGLVPEIYAVTYGWRRLPPWMQPLTRAVDRVAPRLGAASFAHTLMLVARRPA